MLFAAGPLGLAAASASTVLLAKGALKTLAVTRWICMAACLLTAAVGLGAGLFALGVPGEQTATARPGEVDGPPMASARAATDDPRLEIQGPKANAERPRNKSAAGVVLEEGRPEEAAAHFFAFDLRLPLRRLVSLPLAVVTLTQGHNGDTWHPDCPFASAWGPRESQGPDECSGRPPAVFRRKSLPAEP
jgi:hypothetical protein